MYLIFIEKTEGFYYKVEPKSSIYPEATDQIRSKSFWSISGTLGQNQRSSLRVRDINSADILLKWECGYLVKILLVVKFC